MCQTGYYYDSFGFAPKLDEFDVMDSCDDWSFNPTPLQGFSTTTCGQNCLFFIYHFARGFKMQEIVELLDQDKDRIVNDAIVNAFVNKTFDTETILS